MIQHQQSNCSPDFHQIQYRGPSENVGDHACFVKIGAVEGIFYLKVNFIVFSTFINQFQ